MDYYLEHHGIKGQKWGVRRYQNANGTLTEAGKKRYGGDKKLYNRAVSVTRKHEQAVADDNKRKRQVAAKSREYRSKAKELNSYRSKAARAATLLVAGPFANTTYTNYMRTSGSKSEALAKTVLTGIASNAVMPGFGNYTVQRIQQRLSAEDAVSKSNPSLNRTDINRRLRESEQEFKRIKK